MVRSSRPLLYGLVGCLAAIELAILYGALHPEVDATYRARYIDGTSQCWPLPVSGAYQMGATLTASKASLSPGLKNVLVCGWLDPEVEGIWAFGTEARLRFQVTHPGSSLELRLTLRPFAPAGRPAQSVPVSLNGTLLTTLQLEGEISKTETLAIPADRIPASGVLDLALTFPLARSPRSLGIGTDDRLIGGLLSQIQLVEQDTDERGSDSSGTAL